MNLPKDWSKKPDWLDRAKEPSHLGAKEYTIIAVVLISAAIALIGGIVFFVGPL